jgi:hypothetical protein
MNRPILDEWDVLGTEWRAVPDETPPTAVLLERLHRRVRRRSRQRATALALELLLTVAVVGWSMVHQPREGVEAWVLRVGILAFTALVWAFGLWNGRHGWRAEGASTSEFLSLSRRRLAEGRRSILFVRITLAVATIGFAPWLIARTVDGPTGDVGWVTSLGYLLYVAAMLGWCAWYARWLTREREWLDALARDLARAR